MNSDQEVFSDALPIMEDPPTYEELREHQHTKMKKDASDMYVALLVARGSYHGRHDADRLFYPSCTLTSQLRFLSEQLELVDQLETRFRFYLDIEEKEFPGMIFMMTPYPACVEGMLLLPTVPNALNQNDHRVVLSLLLRRKYVIAAKLLWTRLSTHVNVPECFREFVVSPKAIMEMLFDFKPTELTNGLWKKTRVRKPKETTKETTKELPKETPKKKISKKRKLDVSEELVIPE